MKYCLLIFCFVLLSGHANAQTLTTRSTKALVDFSDPSKQIDSSFPKISWTLPSNQVSFQQDSRFQMTVQVKSKHPLKSISILVTEKGESQPYASKIILTSKDNTLEYVLEQTIVLAASINVIEVIVENAQGVRGIADREVHVGETILADAKKLRRTDYALVIYTNNYDHWPTLNNPGFDATTIANQLKDDFGFQVDLLENPSQERIWTKLKEFADRKYEPLDQVFIFIAGHGHFEQSFKEGYVVLKESIPNETGHTSYISHNRLRNNITSIPCEHIFLTMDVCFGGTFDEEVANSRGVWTDPEVSQSEFILRKLAYRTRKYLTSGGKEYVSDGKPGHHSPFASKLIDALKTLGGNDGILTLSELMVFTEKSTPAPQFGRFGDDAVGSEFVFVVR